MDILGGDTSGTNPVGAVTGSGGSNNQSQGLSGLNQAQLLNALAPGLFNSATSGQSNPTQSGANLLNSSFNLLGLFSPQTFNSNSLMSAPQATMPFMPEPIPQVNGQTQAPAPAPASAPSAPKTYPVELIEPSFHAGSIAPPGAGWTASGGQDYMSNPSAPAPAIPGGWQLAGPLAGNIFGGG